MAYVVQTYGRGPSYVVADNDIPPKNGTEPAGAKAAKATGLPWWMPPEPGTDANDLDQSPGGRDELRRQLLKLVRQEKLRRLTVNPTWEIRQGDVLDRLREMPAESVHCVVTSPPYWGLRNYGVDGAYGLEPTIGSTWSTWWTCSARCGACCARMGRCG